MNAPPTRKLRNFNIYVTYDLCCLSFPILDLGFFSPLSSISLVLTLSKLSFNKPSFESFYSIKYKDMGVIIINNWNIRSNIDHLGINNYIWAIIYFKYYFLRWKIKKSMKYSSLKIKKLTNHKLCRGIRKKREFNSILTLINPLFRIRNSLMHMNSSMGWPLQASMLSQINPNSKLLSPKALPQLTKNPVKRLIWCLRSKTLTPFAIRSWNFQQ